MQILTSPGKPNNPTLSWKRPSLEASSLQSAPHCPTLRTHLCPSCPRGPHSPAAIPFFLLSQQFCWETARGGQLTSATLGKAQDWAGGITEGTLLLTRRAPPSHGRARKETVPLGRAQVLSPLLLQQSFQFKIITFPIKISKGTGPGSQSHQRFSSILLPPKAFLRSPLPSEQV